MPGHSREVKNLSTQYPGKMSKQYGWDSKQVDVREPQEGPAGRQLWAKDNEPRPESIGGTKEVIKWSS